jgi:rhamnogalacturonyl hydrolase YesR
MQVGSRDFLWFWIGAMFLLLCSARPLFAWQSQSPCPLDTLKLVNDPVVNKNAYKNAVGWKNAVYHLGNLAAYTAVGKTSYRNHSQSWASNGNWEVSLLPATCTGIANGAECALDKRYIVGQVSLTWPDGEPQPVILNFEGSTNRSTWKPLGASLCSVESSGISTDPEFFDFRDALCESLPDACARYQYIRYTACGSAPTLPNVQLYNTYNYADHQACGQSYIELAQLLPAAPLPVLAVTASANDGNVPANVLDNNLSTRWSAKGNGQWIRFDLGTSQPITHVAMAWYQGNSRRYTFDLQVSDDQSHWTTVLQGQSSGTTKSLEIINFPTVTGRYLRYVGHGNSSADKPLWNHLTEVDIYHDTRLKSITGSIDIQIERAKADDWWWIDAMFMAAPVWARLCDLYKNPAYCEKLFALYTDTKTRRNLFDEEAGLWYRDEKFIQARTASNQKVFWSRGNGWVIGALARVLQYLPANDPHRGEYLTMVQTMAAALKQVQRTDGFWNVNLADPNDPPGLSPAPETSGTALFTYALAWGVNQGFLDRATYMPVVLKAWDGMVNKAVRESDGKLLYVQGVGDNPADGQPVNASSPEQPYGIGAFLLAGSEVAKLRNVTFTTTCTAGGQ